MTRYPASPGIFVLVGEDADHLGVPLDLPDRLLQRFGGATARGAWQRLTGTIDIPRRPRGGRMTYILMPTSNG
jgi:hypothetical protein